MALISKTYRPLRRYGRLFIAFFKYSLKAETEFRANLIFYSLENIVWLGLAVIGVELIFGQVSSIAYWTKNEAYLVIFIASLFQDVCWTLIYRNLGIFSHWVRFGELDYHLLQPGNLRFRLSFRTLEFDHYVRIILELFLIHKYVGLTVGSFSLWHALVAMFLFGCWFMVFYSLYFGITASNVWFVNLANLLDLFGSVNDISGKPIYIFQRQLLFFFSFVLPVGFIATFPAEALLGRIDPAKIVIAPLLAIIFYIGSQKFFNFALKHYSSVSR